MLTTSFIQDRLHGVAAERGVNVRYACESGSRGWGLASTDSDYDETDLSWNLKKYG